MKYLRKKKRRGLSLVELLLALTLLTIAIGTVLELFTLSTRAATFDRNRNEALSNLKLLASFIESSQIILPDVNEPYYQDPQGIVTDPNGTGADNTFVPLDDPPFSSLDFVNPEKFERSISVRPISGFEGYLIEVIITLRWKDTLSTNYHKMSLTVCVSRI